MPRLGTTRTYRCPDTHNHGINSVCYVAHKCGCEPCVAGNAARARDRRKRLAYGRWDERVPAAPVVEHVARLHGQGMSSREIGLVAGVPQDSVDKLRRQKWVAVSRANAILAVRPVTIPCDRSLVDATGTRRRLQALVCMGWTGAELMGRLGKDPGQSTRFLTAQLVQEGTRAAVAALYDELWNVTPPDSYGSRRARLRAQRNNWIAPLGWDDIDTDPEPVVIVKDADRSAWMVDELAHFHGIGESPDYAVKQLGRQASTLSQLCYRHDRDDLGRWVAQAERRAA